MAIGTTAALIGAGIAAGGGVASAALQSRAAGNAARTQSDAAGAVAEQADRRAEEAATGVTGATGEANTTLRELLGLSEQDAAPFAAAGRDAITSLRELTAPGGELTKGFEFNNFEGDPGFQFRLQEGQKAIERSAAARGIGSGGSTLKALTRFSQDFASNEFDRAFNRAERTFRTNQNERFQRLADVANFGQNANSQLLSARSGFGGQIAANTIGGAQAAGDFRLRGTEIAGNAVTGAANARAAGQVASGNAFGGAINQAAQAPLNFLILRDLLRPRPTTGNIGT